MIKAVVFDLDHTLFDRHGTLKAVAKHFRDRFDMNPEITDEEFTRKWIYADDTYVYNGWRYIHKNLIENDVFRTAPTFEEYMDFVVEQFHHNAVSFPEAVPMLEGLKKQGFKTALITNGHHSLQYKKVDMLGLRDVFDEIIVSGDTDFEKPDARIFLLMAEKLGVGADEMVYVGDHPVNDIEGATSAGCKTIWMKCKSPLIECKIPPDETVLKVEEVPFAVEKIINRSKD